MTSTHKQDSSGTDTPVYPEPRRVCADVKVYPNAIREALRHKRRTLIIQLKTDVLSERCKISDAQPAEIRQNVAP
jgi:hypothetical protein